MASSRTQVRLRHLEKIWNEIIGLKQPPQMDRWLASRLKQERSFGSRDRQWYGDLVFASLRQLTLAQFARWQREAGADRASAESLAEWRHAYPEPDDVWQAAGKAPAEGLLRLVLAAASAEAAATLARDHQEDASQPDLHEHPLLDAELRAHIAVELVWLQSLRQDLAQLGSLDARLLLAGLPPWYGAYVTRRLTTTSTFAEQAFLSMLATRPPLWLRINDRARHDAIVRQLQEALGYEAVDVRGSAIGIRGERHKRSIRQLPVIANGEVEIQDLASQRLGEALGVEPGMLVWDACAGGGGKTMQIAANLRGCGAVYASDIRSYKLEEVQRRAEKAKFATVQVLPWQGGGSALTLPERVSRHGGFDRVLVDAPCSGSGTWRRSPDARFRLGNNELGTWTQTQGAVLTTAAAYVAPKGRLTYSTCSWLVDENEAVVEAFVAANPDWQIVESYLVGAPQEDADTMYVANLCRRC